MNLHKLFFKQKLAIYSDERVLFVKEDCPHCRKALDALDSVENIAFIPVNKRIAVKNVDNSPSAMAELQKWERVMGEELGTPFLHYDGTVVSGVLGVEDYRAMLIQLIWG